MPHVARCRVRVGVPGFNDVVGQDPFRGTCSSCHDVPNIGGHAVIRMMDTGTADEPSCDPALPLLTVQNTATLETRRVCDLGRGGNGVWADVAKFRVPPLRGLAARAPYFHDGQARTIAAVIRYYEKRFDMRLSHGERDDLEAFLGAL
jgi:cytochrome c peroxidase